MNGRGRKGLCLKTVIILGALTTVALTSRPVVALKATCDGEEATIISDAQEFFARTAII
jgi:hypothetical protein